ncbi:hypothetical protein F8M41_015379 [Gigaspora margarita]|uniref:Uncharacterized protein n=1 Tax=Gigaspora margarita TaxID=4874 RepID=A0A8H3ZX99_GIGMA|nr:hypothetical protein F8M41_015379 [Gigaspora margarita]
MIGNQVPKQTETCNNDAWFAVDLKDFGKYDLTDSLKEFKSEIIEKINSKFCKSRKNVNNKKRKLEEPEKKLEIKNEYESDSIVASDDEVTKLILESS